MESGTNRKRSWIASVSVSLMVVLCCDTLATAVESQKGDTDAGRRDLAVARDVFRRIVNHAVSKLKQTIGKEIVIVLNVRPTKQGPTESDAAAAVQEVFREFLIYQGIMALSAETEYTPGRGMKLIEKKIDDPFKNGRLPNGALLDQAKARELKAIYPKAAYLLVPRLAVTRTRIQLLLQLYDLSDVRRLVKAAVTQPVSTRRFSLKELCGERRIPPLNLIMLTYGVLKFGERLRGGTCLDFVRSCAVAAGGWSNGGYGFGPEVDAKDALPGDVVSTKGHIMLLFAPNNEDTGKGIILHQNVGGRKYVVYGRLGNFIMKRWKFMRPITKAGMRAQQQVSRGENPG